MIVLGASLALAIIAALAPGETAEADRVPRSILVLPYDVSGLASDEQWLGEGVAQLISLGLTQSPALVQIDRFRLRTVTGSMTSSEAVRTAARDVRADAVLYGSVQRSNGALLLRPVVLVLHNEQATTIALEAMSGSDADLLMHAAALPIAYMRALQVEPTESEKTRIEKAARPYLRLGRIYATTDRCGEALNAYRRALDLDPSSTEARRGAEHIAAGRCIPVGP